MNLEFKNFTLLSDEEHIALLEIRNSYAVRKQMTSNDIIQFSEHKKWVNQLLRKSDKIYFAVKYNNELVGSVYITDLDKKSKRAMWGLYFTQKTHPLVSTFATYFLFEYIFNKMKIDVLRLEVKNSNDKAIAFDKRLGFIPYQEDEKYLYMSLSSEQWHKSKSNILLKSLKNKIDKIQFKIYQGDKMREIIKEKYLEVLEQIGNELQVPELNDNVILLESGLDSLGFAILVATLDEVLGYDPFTMMDEPFYPSTFGEFVEIYEKLNPNK